MRYALLTMLLILVAGCSGVDMNAYRENRPQLDLFDYFQGNTRGWGIVQDRKGTLVRQFVVDIIGTVDDSGQLVLDEKFDWSDGEKTTRIWKIRSLGESRFRGVADDVPAGAEGLVSGNVLNWNYRIDLVVDGTTWNVKFDDWMFMVSEEMIINKATIIKFGIEVGEVTIVFKK